MLKNSTIIENVYSYSLSDKHIVYSTWSNEVVLIFKNCYRKIKQFTSPVKVKLMGELLILSDASGSGNNILIYFTNSGEVAKEEHIKCKTIITEFCDDGSITYVDNDNNLVIHNLKENRVTFRHQLKYDSFSLKENEKIFLASSVTNTLAYFKDSEKQWEISTKEFESIPRGVGCTDSVVFVLFGDNILASISLMNGSLIDSWKIPPDSEDAEIILNYFFYDKKKQLINVLSRDKLLSIDPVNKTVTVLWQSDIDGLIINASSFCDELVFFRGIENWQLFTNFLGCINRESKELVWLYKVEQENVALQAPQMMQNKIYSLGTNRKLYIGEI